MKKSEYLTRPTRDGVYHNFEITPYYSDYGWWRFYFSSKFYKDNFDTRVEQYELDMSTFLYKRYHFLFEAHTYSAFYAYMSIEKRGFKVENLKTGTVYRDPSKLSFKIELKEE